MDVLAPGTVAVVRGSLVDHDFEIEQLFHKRLGHRERLGNSQPLGLKEHLETPNEITFRYPVVPSVTVDLVAYPCRIHEMPR